MNQISSWEATFWLFVFLHLSVIGSVIWMTFMATAFGHTIKSIQIGSIIRYTARKKQPMVILGLVPMVGQLQLNDAADGTPIKRSLIERAANGFGQMILPLLFAAIVIGPAQTAVGFIDIAKTYFNGALAPLSVAPKELTSFWAHMLTSPLAALAYTAITFAFINSIFRVWEISFSMNSEDDVDGTTWDKIRNTLTAIPMFLIFGWVIGFFKALF
jgi:hypothetical protein